MKRYLALIFAVLFAGTAWSYNFSAVSPSGHTLYYNYTTGGVVVTTQRTTYPNYTVAPAGALIIPDSVTNAGTTYAVVGIGYAVFNGCTGLTSVSIPNTVTSIDAWAFNNCTGLTSLNIPNSLTTIGDMAFKNCSGLTNLFFPNTVQSIGNSAFLGCTGIAILDVPSTVTSIQNDAFSLLKIVRYCGTATGSPWGALHVSCNVYQDGDFVYADSTKADLWGYLGTDSSVVVADGVHAIGAQAFGDCSTIVEVELPYTVDSIGEMAFMHCDSLRHVILRSPVPPVIEWYSFGYVDDDCLFSIPCGTYDLYTESLIWYRYRNQMVETEVILNVTLIADSTQGSAFVVPVDGLVISCDSTMVISATANYGYHFDSWSTGSTSATDTVVLLGDTIITAIFAPDAYSVTLLSDNDSLGTTQGSGDYLYLDTATITATATAPHYHFTHWSDGVTDNPRQLVVTEMVELTAYFAIDTHLVTVVSDNPVMGTVSGGGWVEACSEMAICATPLDGYHFLFWSDNDTNASRVVVVTEDTTFTAYFAANELEGITPGAREATIQVHGKEIVVQGAHGQRIAVYDVAGRVIGEASAADTQVFRMTYRGVYLVKVGHSIAQKVIISE